MTNQRHHQAKALFLEALGRSAPEQTRFLAEACGGDDELREEVERLLVYAAIGTDRLAPRPVADALVAEAVHSDTSQATSLASGTRIADRYRVERLLGRGGMGQVYLATDELFGQPIAIKFIAPTVTTRTTSLGRLLDEARAARTVVAPEVCRVFDVGVDHGEPFLTMELVAGTDLAKVLRASGRFDVQATRRLGCELCLALEAIHDKGLLHRDLKPANILLDEHNRAKVTDFGIAVRQESQRPEDALMGTPGYLAPEVARGAKATVQSDLYGLGMVLFEARTGQPAQARTAQSRTACGRMSRAVSSTAAGAGAGIPTSSEATDPLEMPLMSPWPDETDPVLEQVIRSCLSPLADQRPPDARTVRRALEAKDPLEGFLALGERPSPRVLAASRARGVLTSRYAPLVATLAVILLATLLALRPRVATAQRAGWDTPPEQLAERARRLIDQVLPEREIGREIVAEAFGYERVLDERVPGIPYPRGLASREQTAFFWYRQSAYGLATWNAMEIAANGARVTPLEPSPMEWGSTLVAFDPRGRLHWFQHTPEPNRKTDTERTPDWSPLFRAAALDGVTLEPSPVQVPWPSAAAQRSTWRGWHEGRETLVEVGHLGSRPILFMALEIATPEDGDSAVSARQDLAEALAYAGVASVYGLLLLPAWRNLRRGRGDPWGAFRLALATLIASYGSFLLQADHPTDTVEAVAFIALGFAGPLIKAVAAWILYMGIEPLLQSDWPRSLVSWSRVLAGHLRSPVVASHALIGITAGSAVAILDTAARAVAALERGSALPVPQAPPLALPALRHGFASLLDAPIEGTYLAFVFLAVLGLCRFLLRSPWLAIPTAVALYASHAVLASPAPGIAALFTLSMVGTYAWIATRYGVLSLVVTLATLELFGRFPLTTDPDAWFVAHTAIALGAWFASLAACLLVIRFPSRP